MRQYIFTFEVPNDELEEGQTIAMDLKALSNGDLTVYDLMDLAKDSDTAIEMHYYIKDI